MAVARLTLRSSWKRGVVMHGSNKEEIRIWRFARWPVAVVWAIVRPVAPVPSVVRRWEGVLVRCSRLVVGRSV